MEKKLQPEPMRRTFAGIMPQTFIRIIDPKTKEVLLNKRGENE